MTTERKIAVQYDVRGNPFWESLATPTDDSCAVCYMVPDRIIPIVFIPGVMGSNLKSRTDNVRWRLDSSTTISPWLVRGAEIRKKSLTPENMVLDDQGTIPEGTAQSREELHRRGWGEIAHMSYGPFLVWLENALNDFDDCKNGLRQSLLGQSLQAELGETPLTKEEIALSYRYRFPVHVCGYNWLDDNAHSATHLNVRIRNIINRYRKEGKRCEKVILVTHSMGGLVARYSSEVLGIRSLIFGIVHGVMPSLGAAAVYRRMKSGTENSGEGALGFLKGLATSAALGSDGAEMTAVLSSAPGPLQLLPTAEYGNHWLKIKTGNDPEISLPKNGDPYTEIYTVRDRWWGLCEDRLINPLNEEKDPQKRQQQIDSDWKKFAVVISKNVFEFHEKITKKYHHNTYAFYGASEQHRAYGEVSWFGSTSLGATNIMNATLEPAEGTLQAVGAIGSRRTVDVPYNNRQKTHPFVYQISAPDEPGDGTVPRRSGVALKNHVNSVLCVKVEHEPAFKASEAAQHFTLRAIVKIAQEVQKTALAYR